MESSASKVTLALPDSTTITSSTSTSVTVPAVISQTPISSPPRSASSALDAFGAPATTDSGSRGRSARGIAFTSVCSKWVMRQILQRPC